MRRKSARFLSVFLPVVVAACSSEPGPTAPGPAVAVALVVTGLPGSARAGVAVNGTVTAKDNVGNTVTGYTGTVRFTSTDPAAVLPSDYTFVVADRGSYSFRVTFGTAGQQTVTATDVATTSINGGETVTVIKAPKATDVFAVGTNGTILRYDGMSWTAQASGTTGNIHGVWGTSGSNVFAVGDSGMILHYDGTSWTRQVSGSTFCLEGVWGSSGSDVFAVGCSGTILHYDGSSWTHQMMDSTYFFTSVWGSSPTDVFAPGSAETNFQWSGRILHYDGTSWTTQRIDPTISLFAVWGSSGHDVYADGDSTLHYDGTTWTGVDAAADYGIWGSSGSDVFTVGDNGEIAHYDGAGRWTVQYFGILAGGPWELDGIWGSSGSDVFAVGQGGYIMHYDGTTWTIMTSGAASFLWAVWGSSQTR